MKKFILAVILCLIALPVWGADVYICDTSVCGQTPGAATNWTNALDDLPTTLVRGNTYYVADGTYAGRTFNTAESSDSYIYIKKCTSTGTGASQSTCRAATGWDSSYGDGVATFTGGIVLQSSYWDFDGVVGSGNTGHGIYIAGPCIEWATSYAVNATVPPGASYSVNHIRLSHIHLGTCGDRPHLDGDMKDAGIYAISNATNGNITDWTVSYCYINDTNAAAIATTYASNWTVEYCNIGKRFCTGGDDYCPHGELITINYSGLNAGWIIRYNTIYDSAGTGMIVIKDSVQSGFDIYGNVFYQSSNIYGTSNGAICNTSGDTTTGVKVYNNTFYYMTIPNSETKQAPVTFYGTSTGNIVSNNIFWDTLNLGTNIATRSYNLWNNATYAAADTNGQSFTGGIGTLFTSVATYTFTLAGTSDPTTPGTNLGSPYNTDMLGTTRLPAAWSKGAYQFGSGAVPITGCTISGSTR